MSPSSARQLDPLHEILFATNLGRNVDTESVFAGFSAALADANPERRTYLMGILLNGIMAKGPTKDEVVGLLNAAFALDEFQPEMRPAFPSKKKTLTVAGSGKKGLKTVNLSSLATIVAACDGSITILKLCSPSTSSVTGSQDFLSIIGGKPTLCKEDAVRIAEELGVGFFPVEDVLPKFASVYSGWYYAPHAMSFALAGMACPYKTDYTYYGLAHPNVTLSMEVFRHYHYPQVLVTSSTFDGLHYIDEVLSQCGIAMQGYHDSSDVNPRRSTFYIDDEAEISYEKPVYKTVEEMPTRVDNVAKGLSAFIGNKDLATQVAINAAVYLVTCKSYPTFKSAYERCLEIIDSNAPIEKLYHLVKSTGGNTAELDKLLTQARQFIS